METQLIVVFLSYLLCSILVITGRTAGLPTGQNVVLILLVDSKTGLHYINKSEIYHREADLSPAPFPQC